MVTINQDALKEFKYELEKIKSYNVKVGSEITEKDRIKYINRYNLEKDIDIYYINTGGCIISSYGIFTFEKYTKVNIKWSEIQGVDFKYYRPYFGYYKFYKFYRYHSRVTIISEDALTDGQSKECCNQFAKAIFNYANQIQRNTKNSQLNSVLLGKQGLKGSEMNLNAKERLYKKEFEECCGRKGLVTEADSYYLERLRKQLSIDEKKANMIMDLLAPTRNYNISNSKKVQDYKNNTESPKQDDIQKVEQFVNLDNRKFVEYPTLTQSNVNFYDRYSRVVGQGDLHEVQLPGNEKAYFADITVNVSFEYHNNSGQFIAERGIKLNIPFFIRKQSDIEFSSTYTKTRYESVTNSSVSKNNDLEKTVLLENTDYDLTCRISK